MPPRHCKIVEETLLPVEDSFDPSEATPEPVIGKDVNSNNIEEEEEEEELEYTITHRPRTALTEDPDEEEEEAEEEEKEIADVGSSTTKQGAKRKAPARIITKKVIPKLPDPSIFDNVFLHSKPSHGGHSKLPPELLLNKALPPLEIFSLFFSNTILDQIATNTNAYAALKGAGASQGSRKWEDTTVSELRIFISITIYLGIFVPKDPVHELWTTSPRHPKHDISHFMTLSRFQQLKRFLHISSPLDPEEHWYSKLEPLSSKLSADFSKYYIPSTDSPLMR